LRYANPDVFITGMAAGLDLWAADEAHNLGITTWAAIPWRGHVPRAEDVELYAKIRDVSDRVIYVTDVDDYPGPWVYHNRNEWMVDNATHVMAYLNPAKTTGGTYACCQYAKNVGKPIANIYGDAPF
jgi:uncharacterized phage-like protein YoqJ